MNSFSVSDQNARPIDSAIAVSIQPRRCTPASEHRRAAWERIRRLEPVGPVNAHAAGWATAIVIHIIRRR
jgi:hypothetical protein